MDSAGKLLRYALNNPASTTPTWSAATSIGTGWSGFGRVLGGPGNRLYGINASGVQRFRWTGSGWEPARTITTSWTAYATAAYRNKITLDEAGDFYLVDGAGRLRYSRYDESRSTWSTYNRVLDTGWNRFDLIVAGTYGTLYGRTPQGSLVRFRYDPASQRWLERGTQVGSGWQQYTRGVLSAGGDTLFGITGNGAFHQNRFREDDGTWAVSARPIGSKWTSANVVATTDTCKLTVDHSPVEPRLPLTVNETPAVVQDRYDPDFMGRLHFAYTDDGMFAVGDSLPGDPGRIQFASEPGLQYYTGRPALTVDNNEVVRAYAQRTDGDFLRRESKGVLTDLGGALVATPITVKVTDGYQAYFGVAADGTFWHRRPDPGTGEPLPWTQLPGSGLTGALSATYLTGGVVGLFAIGSDGSVVTARYRDGALVQPWRALGGGDAVGVPAAIFLYSSDVQVFVRTTAGDVVTQQIAADGTFPGRWTRVGDGSLRGTGSPAVVYDDHTDRLVVFSRVGSTMYAYEERSFESLIWKDPVPASETGAIASDPVALRFQSGQDDGYLSSGYVARATAGGLTVWTTGAGTRGR